MHLYNPNKPIESIFTHLDEFVTQVITLNQLNHYRSVVKRFLSNINHFTWQHVDCDDLFSQSQVTKYTQLACGID